MKARLLFVHALSPLHAGTGQGVGVIDLPIAREKSTGLPYLPGSSIKGTLRDQFGAEEKELAEKIFGPEGDRASEHAGAIQFTDQTMLLLPVRSLAGTFAWVTSPYVLRRLVRDAESTNDANGTGWVGLPTELPRVSKENECVVAPEDECMLIHRGEGKVFLEDLDLTPDAEQGVAARAWAEWLGGQIFPSKKEWREMLIGRFCVVHDDALAFLLNTATEITARIKMDDDSKTVDKKTGGLWYEEALPTETVLFGLTLAFPNEKTVVKGSPLSADAIHRYVADKLAHTLQFGGKATVGRGLCRVTMSGL